MYYGKINQEMTGFRIRRLMDERGISVTEMAARMGCVSTDSIYKWRKGQALPSIDNLFVLSRALGVPIEEILAVDR